MMQSSVMKNFLSWTGKFSHTHHTQLTWRQHTTIYSKHCRDILNDKTFATDDKLKTAVGDFFNNKLAEFNKGIHRLPCLVFYMCLLLHRIIVYHY